MTGQRPWLVSGGLLVVAGVLTSVCTWRHWASCRSGPGSAACQFWQDQTYGLPLWGDAAGRDVLGTALASIAAGLLGLAWVVVISWSRGSAFRRILAVVVGLQPLLLMALVDLELWRPGQFTQAATNGWFSWPAEVLVLPFLLGAGWVLEESALRTVRLIVLGWAVTSFGPLHHFIDYVLTTQVSGVIVDSPPGLGFITALTQVALGLTVIFLSVVLHRSDEPEPEDDDDERGRGGFTLAA